MVQYVETAKDKENGKTFTWEKGDAAKVIHYILLNITMMLNRVNGEESRPETEQIDINICSDVIKAPQQKRKKKNEMFTFVSVSEPLKINTIFFHFFFFFLILFSFWFSYSWLMLRDERACNMLSYYFSFTSYNKIKSMTWTLCVFFILLLLLLFLFGCTAMNQCVPWYWYHVVITNVYNGTWQIEWGCFLIYTPKI